MSDKKTRLIRSQAVSPELLQRSRELRKNQTDQEKLIWEELRSNRLDGWHFRRHQVIGGYIVDFYCSAAGLIVEVDSPIQISQIQYDAKRDNYLTSPGLRVLRFKNSQIEEYMWEVIDTIRNALS